MLLAYNLGNFLCTRTSPEPIKVAMRENVARHGAGKLADARAYFLIILSLGDRSEFIDERSMPLVSGPVKGGRHSSSALRSHFIASLTIERRFDPR